MKLLFTCPNAILTLSRSRLNFSFYAVRMPDIRLEFKIPFIYLADNELR